MTTGPPAGDAGAVTQPPGPGPAEGVGRVFLRLGLTSFGGPVAHIGYFRNEFVVRRRWLKESQYADLVALAQFLPGPASSQVGMGIGLVRSGIGGAVRAWLGFTLPSAVLLIGAGLVVGGGAQIPAGVVAGLQVAVVAVVAQAVVQMARGLLRTRLQIMVAVASAAALLLGQAVWLAPVVLAVAAGVGVLADRGGVPRSGVSRSPERIDPVLRLPSMPGWAPGSALIIFWLLLLTLPILARIWPSDALVVIAGCYRAGALVFGGGHVVLPMLQEAVVGPGLMGESEFLAGYGLAAAVPGPLFAFAGYVGAALGGVLLGSAAVVAIFLPGFLLVVGVLGHWHRVAQKGSVRSALAAVNAAVVGLLAAALYDPVWITGITGWPELLLGAAALFTLWRFRTAPHLVVLACAGIGWVMFG